MQQPLLQEWTFFSSLGWDFTGVLSDGGRLGDLFSDGSFYLPGRDNRLYFMVFPAKEGGSKGQALLRAGMGIVRRILPGMLSFMMILWTLRTLAEV